MGLRQRDWARRTREKLLDLMGRRCARCQTPGDDANPLTFDCIEPQGSHHHRQIGWSWRMSFYRAQFAADNLQVLCNSCNARKGEVVIDFRVSELNREHCGEFQPF